MNRIFHNLWSNVSLKLYPTLRIDNSIWIPYTPCGRFKKLVIQRECEFQVDKLIWHFWTQHWLPLWWIIQKSLRGWVHLKIPTPHLVHLSKIFHRGVCSFNTLAHLDLALYYNPSLHACRHFNRLFFYSCLIYHELTSHMHFTTVWLAVMTHLYIHEGVSTESSYTCFPMK